MRWSRRRYDGSRIPRFESVEPRLLLSGDAVADFWIDYYVEDQRVDEVGAALADAHELTGLDQARADYGFTGSGQTVAVIDSGIAYDHYALGGGFGPGYRVVGGFDFTELDADPHDDGPAGSHGTHVAGIVGSSDATSPGVAPGVDLVALRVFNDNGSGYFNWVEEALQWVHDNRFAFENPITAVNLSLGTSYNGNTVPGGSVLEDEFAQLESDGIFIAVAAGNNFTIYDEPGLSYPAVSPHVVPVASVDDGGTLSYFSQRNERVIAAPGRGVRSTVPDYAGNGNGVDDDFLSYSGTSMASPYVAGASVLLREAYEFVSTTGVDQQMLYELMASTADTVFDPQTGLSYNRLNLSAAFDAIMPADDFGSTADAAYDLQTIVDTSSLGGTIGRLNDQDWFTFTAAASGVVTFQVDTTDEMVARWEAPLAGLAKANVGTATVDGDVLAFDVAAGETYILGLGTDAGLGHYTVEVTLEAAPGPADWGTVDQAVFEGYRVDAAGQEITLAAGADGLLSVEAFFDHATADVDLQLLDAAGQVVGRSDSTGDYERIDVAATAGETFTLRATAYGGGVNDRVDFRVTNLVAQTGDAVVVSGTDADDLFTVTAGDVHELSINGVEYAFGAGSVRTIEFDGKAGSDRATMTGTAGNETAVLHLGWAELVGGDYRLTAVDVETLELFGGGSDTATLYDSIGNDTFVGARGFAGMFGPGYANMAIDFGEASAYAYGGGFDVVKLYDSPGNDLFVASSGYGGMFGEGFANHTRGFDKVHAFATAGGHDQARLYDSPGDDVFDANPIEAVLRGDGFYNRAKFFEEVHAFATAGGNDTVYLYDSAGDDTFFADAVQSGLYGSGFYNRAKFFEQVYAFGYGGGNDSGFLYDSAGDDQLQADGDSASLAVGSAVNWLYGFEYVRAQSTAGGTDNAEIAAVDFLLELDGDWI